jgi:cysteine desulfurase
MKIGRTVYLDHQATTPMDQRVFSAMTPYFCESFGNPHSADHSIGWKAAQAVEGAASCVAGLIGADADEIIFTSGATEANNLALLGLGRHAFKGNRRRILVSAIEHKCVLAAGHALHEQFGYQVEVLPVDVAGFVNMKALSETLADDVLAVSVMAVNNEIGTIQGITEISRAVRAHGALFHCDAAQAPGAIDLQMATEFVDLLSLSSHKMYGPQGIGALFIRRSLHSHIEPIIYGGGQQQNLRSGTVPVALCVGMGAAAALLNTPEESEMRIVLRDKRDKFVHMLLDLPWQIVLNGPESASRHPGNANICFVGFDAHEILNTLQPHLAASTSSACTSGIPTPSHVLRAIGLSDEKATSSIRFSLGRNTTDEDVDEAVHLIAECLSRLSQISHNCSAHSLGRGVYTGVLNDSLIRKKLQ